MDGRSLVRSIALVAPIAMLVACGGGGDAPEPASQPSGSPPAAAPSAPAAGGDVVEQGRQVFAGAGICFTCHGSNGEGTALGPALNDNTWLWIENPQQDLQAKLVDRIRQGVPQPREYPSAMPPMGGVSLTEDQLQAVSAFVASLNR